MNKKEITLSDAIQVVKERLKYDDRYYEGWYNMIDGIVWQVLQDHTADSGRKQMSTTHAEISKECTEKILNQILK